MAEQATKTLRVELNEESWGRLRRALEYYIRTKRARVSELKEEQEFAHVDMGKAIHEQDDLATEAQFILGDIQAQLGQESTIPWPRGTATVIAGL